MRHVRPMTKAAPMLAQFESILQLLAVLNQFVTLIERIGTVFGITIFQKE